MRYQSLLVVLLVVLVATLGHSHPSDNDHKIDEKENEIASDSEDVKNKFKPDPKIPKALDPRFNKMLPMPKLNDLDAATKVEKSPKAEKAAVKDETSTLGKHSQID